MDPKLDYGTFYRFVCSLGVALLAASLALPWLVIKESGNIAVTESELTLLAPLSQQVVQKRLNLVSMALDKFWVVSIPLFILGTCCLAYAFYKWRKRQLVSDKQADTDLEKSRLELGKLTSSEIIAKAEQEAQEQEASTAASDGLTQEAQIRAHNPQQHARSVEDIMRIEKLLINSLTSVADNVSSYARLGQQDVDAIAEFLDKAYLFEFKVSRTDVGLSIRVLSKAALNLAQAVLEYRRTKEPNSIGVLLAIVPSINEETLHEASQDAYRKVEDRFGISEEIVRIVFASRDEIVINPASVFRGIFLEENPYDDRI